jgi:hypothetical protein
LAQRAVGGRQRHASRDIGLGPVEEAGELGQPGPQLTGDRAPLHPGPSASFWKAVLMKAPTMARPLLPAWATTFLVK